ncbi:hypothetical protein [Halomarina litorea]|uniref:hypothetical protein n=1 Tax=Halomarina litorea TaxID=2961595 RepID=UPI0020C2D3B7|nr:hypothetical protein [Halomarina sp. BCD28]
MSSKSTDHPDYAAMRTSLRKLNERTDGEGLACPNPTCDGTLRTSDGLLSCGTCAATR